MVVIGSREPCFWHASHGGGTGWRHTGSEKNQNLHRWAEANKMAMVICTKVRYDQRHLFQFNTPAVCGDTGDNRNGPLTLRVYGSYPKTALKKFKKNIFELAKVDLVGVAAVLSKSVTKKFSSFFSPRVVTLTFLIPHVILWEKNDEFFLSRIPIGRRLPPLNRPWRCRICGQIFFLKPS